MTQQPVLPAELVAYFAARDAQRADAVTAVLEELTPRERHLAHDAAVMGYVLGRMHPKDDPHPKDSAVVAEVIAACLALPDLYPGTNALWEIATATPAAAEELTPCGKTVAVDGTTYPPCARHAGHSAAYCRDSARNSYFLAAPDHATEEPK